MKQTCRSLLLMIIIVCMILIDPLRAITSMAAKADSSGEVLNFAPTVDFELKEKKKVDVIVDVGNTAYTMDQVNSMVNEQLRPKLQEAGYDFKLHIEKSSEGATRLYYFLGDNLYYYDVTTKKSTFVKTIGKVPPYTTSTDQTAIFDPNSELLFRSQRVVSTSPISGLNYWYMSYFFSSKSVSGGAGNSYYSGSLSAITSDGFYIMPREGLYVATDSYFRGATPITDIQQQIKNVPDDHLLRLYMGQRSSAGQSEKYVDYLDGQILRVSRTQIGSSGDTPLYDYGLSIVHNAQEAWLAGNDSSLRELSALQQTNIDTSIASFGLSAGESKVSYFKATGEIIYVKPYYKYNSFGNRQSSPVHYDTMIYNPVTKEKRYFEQQDGSKSNSKQSEVIPLEDGKLLFKSALDGLWYYYEDYRDATTRTLIGQLTGNWVTNVGTFSIFQELLKASNGSSYYTLKYVDTLTKESGYITSPNDGTAVGARYPQWYVAKKRYITDIIEEVPYRSDAEKYYIRLDEYDIPHLNNSKQLVKTINALSKQSISYIGAGNINSQNKTFQIQSALSQDSMQYDIVQLDQSFNQIGAYITERKEVDLHVLVAQSGQTKAAIETSVTNLVQQLRTENIIVQPHYVYGTASSTLQELYNSVNWNPDKKQYLLFLHTAAMTDLTDEAYLEGAVTTLASNYAHYLQIGSSSNRTIAESIIAMNESKGKFYSGTNDSSYYADMKQYIIDTALKNLKRVNDVLVLQHDPATNAYSAEINVNMYYDDYETDRKRNERFKTTQDPTIYENHTGLMNGIGQYLEAPTTRFTKVGLYEMTMQAQDEPIADPALNEYWKWSQDSLSLLRLYVHRAPVAKFSAVVRSNKSLTITDYSYDLDRYSRINHGIVEWEWKWKKLDDLTWTDGQLTQLASNTDYFLSLRVKDIDGAWSNDYVHFVTSNPYNQPPVALFEIDPMSVSHRKNATIIDRSYDPDGDAINKREWLVKKDGSTIWDSASQPTKIQLQTAAVNKGLSQLGSYQLSLQVTDALGELSEWHTEWMEVINYPPLANYEDLAETTRDSVNKLINTTVEPDQDGDNVSYKWTLLYKDKSYSLGSTKNPQFAIKNYGLGKTAVGDWQVKLEASDPLGANSVLTKNFTVINQKPIVSIVSSPPFAYIDESYSFSSSDDDPDIEDKSSLKAYWRLTAPSGKVRTFYQADVSSIIFDEKGVHVMEHWAEDQLGAESDIVKASFNVLNKRPVADFTRSPITTYRGVEIDFKSLSTDYDGWVDTYRYELLREGNTPLTLSTDAEFKRTFSSIGTFDIQHTVTDNDGASDSTTKKIYIVNRAPGAEVIEPSGASAAAATEYNTLTPTIRWTMSDADGDHQVQYQLQLKAENGTVLRTTANTTTANQSFTIPGGWISEGTKYRVSVRVYDGYEWSEYAADKYFFVMQNQPPVPGFISAPSVLFEGDALYIHHNVFDPDQDTLNVQYEVTTPNGQKYFYPNPNSNYQLNSSQYSSSAFIMNGLIPGTYTIKQTVDDGKSTPVKLIKMYDATPLNIIGKVSHTEQWESNRQAYNADLEPNSDQYWQAQQFYSGERFMLTADTTLIGIKSEDKTYALAVTATLETTGTQVKLSYENNRRWSGSMWHESFDKLSKGKHTFTFVVYYSNGTRKSHEVEIEIIGKAAQLAGVQRWK